MLCNLKIIGLFIRQSLITLCVTYLLIPLPLAKADTQTLTVTANVTFGVSAVSANPASTSVTITWVTNSPSSSIVDYVLSNDFSDPHSTPEIDTNPYVTNHTVSITNLIPCVKYYYRVRSNRANGIPALSLGNSFMTTECLGNAAVLNQTYNNIPSSGGNVSLLNSSNQGVTLSIPSGFSANDTNFQIQQLSKADILNNVNIPTGFNPIGNYIYTMNALADVTNRMTSFAAPVTVTMSYASSDISGIDPGTLIIERYDTSWTPLANCTVNITSQAVSCQTTGFSTFMLVSNPQTKNTVVAPANTQNTAASSINTPSLLSVPSCSAQLPGSRAPWLYAAIPQSINSVQLYFTDAQMPYDHYAVIYGTVSNTYTYGIVNTGGIGTRTITIGSLLPNTTYYFRIRAGNGCAAGPWTNELSAKTNAITQLNNFKITSSQLTTERTTAPKALTLFVKVLAIQNIPVVRARVTLSASKKTVLTDENGIANFTGVPAGSNTIMVSYNNYLAEEHIYLTGTAKKYTLTLMLSLTLFPNSLRTIEILMGLLVIIYAALIYIIYIRIRRFKRK